MPASQWAKTDTLGSPSLRPPAEKLPALKGVMELGPESLGRGLESADW